MWSLFWHLDNNIFNFKSTEIFMSPQNWPLTLSVTVAQVPDIFYEGGKPSGWYKDIRYCLSGLLVLVYTLSSSVSVCVCVRKTKTKFDWKYIHACAENSEDRLNAFVINDLPYVCFHTYKCASCVNYTLLTMRCRYTLAIWEAFGFLQFYSLKERLF